MFQKFMGCFFYFILSCLFEMFGICEQKKAFFLIYITLYFLFYLPAILVRIKGIFSIFMYNLGKPIITAIFVACLFDVDFFISFEILLFGICLVE